MQEKHALALVPDSRRPVLGNLELFMNCSVQFVVRASSETDKK